MTRKTINLISKEFEEWLDQATEGLSDGDYLEVLGEIADSVSAREDAKKTEMDADGD